MCALIMIMAEKGIEYLINDIYVSNWWGFFWVFFFFFFCGGFCFVFVLWCLFCVVFVCYLFIIILFVFVFVCFISCVLLNDCFESRWYYNKNRETENESV